MRFLFSCLAIYILACTSVMAKPSVSFAFVSYDKFNAKTLCTYQGSKPSPGCDKTYVSNTAVFKPGDLRFAQYREKSSLTMNNSYNRNGAMIPGENIVDINFTLAFKPQSVSRINKALQKRKNNGIAIIINKQIYVIFKAPAMIKDNTISFKKNMDLLLARHITESIALAKHKN